MNALQQLRRLWDHAAWADAALLARLERAAAPPPLAVREYAHVLGAEEVWLSRLVGRPSAAAVWPELSLPEIADLARAVRAGYLEYLANLTDVDVARGVSYVNSAGLAFTTPVGDILLHVALHGQYHRGKVNLMFREAGLDPAPVDFIGFVRGVPAATVAGPPPVAR
jgi:uncharacterized damage-inducible protein DinB